MLVQMRCGVQNYDWGKLGDASAVAQFAASDPKFHVDASEPYAELWMGTHPKVPSEIVEAQDQTLRDVLAADPAALGSAVAAKFGSGELPYLFKVLSIRKALSIQAHPDKALGRELHARDPKNYPDDNHKPEMAIALTAFEGFCGFRPVSEIASFLESVPEFSELVGQAGKDFLAAVQKPGDHRETLRELMNAIMTNSDQRVAAAADALVKRAKEQGAAFAGPHGGQELADLVVRLDGQFPHDIGLFSGILMLNYVKLNKGEAMFLRAKDPHAYISGDIIECMAASDNVVRAGFTPKFKDVSTLVSMLTYETAPVEEQKMVAEKFAPSSGGQAKLFDPPIDEFAVLQQETTKTSKIEALQGASIFIVTEGEGTVASGNKKLPYKQGFVFFAGAGTPLEITASKKTVSYHAVCEV